MVLAWQLLSLLTINLCADVLTLKQFHSFFTLVKPGFIIFPVSVDSLFLQLTAQFISQLFLSLFLQSFLASSDIIFVPFPAFSELSASTLSHRCLSFEIIKHLLTDTTLKRKECRAKQCCIHPSTDNTKPFSSSYHSNQRNRVSYQIQYSTSANFRYFCRWHKTKQIQRQAASTNSFLILLPSKLDWV